MPEITAAVEAAGGSSGGRELLPNRTPDIRVMQRVSNVIRVYPYVRPFVPRRRRRNDLSGFVGNI